MPAPPHRPSRNASGSRSGWIATPASGREHPHGQVQARRGAHGEHADHDRGAQHAVHNRQCTREPPAPSGGAAAVASGVPVSLWLTGESAWFGLPGRADDFSLPHAAPLADLLAGVLAAGMVTLCSQCAARREITPADLIEGVRISGAATFVSEVMAEGAQALVY